MQLYDEFATDINKNGGVVVFLIFPPQKPKSEQEIVCMYIRQYPLVVIIRLAAGYNRNPRTRTTLVPIT